MSAITLTTDFGYSDAYVAAMKGVIISINPRATIVDLCHNIEPQNIAQAAFVLSTSYRYFPDGTIHVAVVDPGVGTERKALLLVTPQAFFLTPDNGVLSYIIEETPTEDIQAIALTNPYYWLAPVSTTFHGRDIFASVAAHLSLGISPHEFGEPVSSIIIFPVTKPQVGEDGVLIGHIVHIDHFGNLITDIRSEELPPGNIFVELGRHIIDGLSSSYADGDALLAIIGSNERIEVSIRNGSAARFLRAEVGGEVKVGINKSSLKGR